ncbi:MAG: LysM peptidoglycan-binding domain-containing protein [Pseudomonadota bacterium]
MKSHLIGSAAAWVIVYAVTSLSQVSAANSNASQADDNPAGQSQSAEPTPEEEFVYLRDVVSIQALRLDQTEQLLKKQTALIEAQAEKIRQLEAVVGQISQVNALGGPASLTGVHTVQPGETLTRISKRYGTSVNALARLNKIPAPYRLSVGQVLALGTNPPQQIAVAPTQIQPVQGQAVQAQPGQVAPVVGAQASVAPALRDAQNTQAPSTSKKTKSGGAPSNKASEQKRVAALPSGNKKPGKPNATGRADNKDNKDSPDGNQPTQVGVRPDDDFDRPYLPLFTDVGGILTPKGTLFVEPGVTYTVSSDNRFFFQGIDVQRAVLIGAIEATDTDRRAHLENIGLRYGITSRFEVDASAAFVNRDDRIAGISLTSDQEETSNISGRGFGDAEIGLHYQLNNGRNFPYTIANVRVKAPTGRGPFDVDRLSNGAETEAAVGSGFWTVEPSLTFSLPTAPAVLFANVGYQFNFETSPNTITELAPSSIIVPVAALDPLLQSQVFNQGEGAGVEQITSGVARLSSFNPGDAIRTNIGVGLSLNEKLSINFAYDQSYFFRTRSQTEFLQSVQTFNNNNGDANADGQNDGEVLDTINLNPQVIVQEQPSATVGTFLFGGSYAVSPRFRIGMTAGIGATDEAPDARVSLRAQYRLFD